MKLEQPDLRTYVHSNDAVEHVSAAGEAEAVRAADRRAVRTGVCPRVGKAGASESPQAGQARRPGNHTIILLLLNSTSGLVYIILPMLLIMTGETIPHTLSKMCKSNGVQRLASICRMHAVLR